MYDLEFVHERNKILIKLYFALVLIGLFVAVPNSYGSSCFVEVVVTMPTAAGVALIITYFIKIKKYIVASMYAMILSIGAICFILTYAHPIALNYISFFMLLGMSTYYHNYRTVILSSIIILFSTNYFMVMDGSVVFQRLPGDNFINMAVAANIVVIMVCMMVIGQIYIGKKMLKQITSTYEKLEKTQKELIIDELTGIYDYRYFEYIVQEKIKNKDKFELIMIDMDKFKNVNDTFGHLAGNKVLQDLTNFIKSKLDDKDIFCRFGGDEFFIILNNLETAEETAENIMKDKKKICTLYEGNKINYEFSVGLYKHENENEDIDYKEIIEKVDKAMYEAKQTGGNKIMRCG